MGDDSFPEEPQPVEATPTEQKEDSQEQTIVRDYIMVTFRINY